MTVQRGARRLTLEQASVRADSVAGVLVEAHVRRGDDWKPDAGLVKGDAVAIAWRDVSAIEERHANVAQSLIAVVAVIALAAAVALHIGLSSYQ